MIERSVGAAFAKEYYRLYLDDPASLSSLYAEGAELCHTNTCGGDKVHLRGTEKISVQLSDPHRRQHWKKAVILHVDIMPSGVSSVTILIGGYFVDGTDSMCFVHNFILKHNGIANIYLIENDCMYVYGKEVQGHCYESNYPLPLDR